MSKPSEIDRVRSYYRVKLREALLPPGSLSKPSEFGRLRVENELLRIRLGEFVQDEDTEQAGKRLKNLEAKAAEADMWKHECLKFRKLVSEGEQSKVATESRRKQMEAERIKLPTTGKAMTPERGIFSRVDAMERKLEARERTLGEVLTRYKRDANLELEKERLIFKIRLDEKNEQIARFRTELDEVLNALAKLGIKPVSDDE